MLGPTFSDKNVFFCRKREKRRESEKRKKIHENRKGVYQHLGATLFDIQMLVDSWGKYVFLLIDTENQANCYFLLIKTWRLKCRWTITFECSFFLNYRISHEMWNTYMLVIVLIQYLVPLLVISITYALIAKVNNLCIYFSFIWKSLIFKYRQSPIFL